MATLHPDNAKRRFRCPSCKGFHGWREEGRAYNQRQLCKCSGVEVIRGVSFPHRPHNPYCEQNLWSEFNRARVLGVPGGYLIGWIDRRQVTAPIVAPAIERRQRPQLDWPPEDEGIPEGRRMHPDEPCPF